MLIRGNAGSRGDAIAEEADEKHGKLMMGGVRENVLYWVLYRLEGVEREEERNGSA